MKVGYGYKIAHVDEILFSVDWSAVSNFWL